MLLGVPALLIAGGLLVAVLMGWVMPKQYESTAVIQVNGGWQDAPTGLGQAFAVDPTPEMLEVEARRVLGVPTFERVRERLALDQRWGGEGEEVMATLREAVKVRVVPDSNLIEITVRLGDASEARDVAHGMAVAHRDLRTEEEKAKAEKLLEALDAELEAQERAVEEKRREMERAMEETGIEDKEARRAPSLYDFNLEHARLDEVIHELESRRGADLFGFAAGLELPQNTAAVIYRQYEDAVREMSQLEKQGLGGAHPRRIAGEIELSMLKGDMEHAIKQIIDEAKERQKIVKWRLMERQDLIHRDRAMSVVHQLEGTEYVDAKRAYENEQQLEQFMRMQTLARRIWLRTAWDGIVLSELPGMEERPVSPDRGAYLVVGGVVGGGMAVVWVMGARWKGRVVEEATG